MKKDFFIFQKLQSLGQSLMVPVSVLPAAGLIVALGRLMQIYSTPSSFIHSTGLLVYSSGLAIFEQLPAIFAIGVAIGFTGGAGVAGLSAVASYFTMMSLFKTVSDLRGLELAINTGVFGGIIAGMIASWVYKKFHETQLHTVLGFFSGKRLVPILSVFFTVFASLLLSLLWPPIQSSINHFGELMTHSSLGPAFYAAGKRLLIPVGLHHVYYPSFLFEFGEYLNSAGEIIKGDSPRFFAGDPKAGLFMASEFPIMLFGLPAAALAMVLRAKDSRKKAIAGVMLTAALTSIITGITEPIEFSFIFVAPLLFVLHVVLAFFSGILTYFADLHLGYTFSASLIDFAVGYFNQKNSMQLWLFIGPLIGFLYFTSFYYLIPIFNFKTPGRESQTEMNEQNSNHQDLISGSESRYIKIIQALGGSENIISLNACITRLRLQLKDLSLIDETTLKNLGSLGLMKGSGGSLQVIFGTQSDFIKENISRILENLKTTNQILPSFSNPTEPSMPLQKDLATDQTSLTTQSFHIISPIIGDKILLEDIPDKTFSSGIMGPGYGINPKENLVIAPFDGKVTTLFHTHHAIGLESDPISDGKGLELLIHVGIDTVNLKGRGFESFVNQGDIVKKGQTLLKFDPEIINKEAKSILTPILFTNIDQFKNFRVQDDQDRVLAESPSN